MNRCTIWAGALQVATALLFPAGSSFAQSMVGGVIDTDTIWTTNGSPYTVDQSVLVINGATLTVEPGVTLKFNPLTSLFVNDGTLRAMGTPDQRIVFTTSGSGVSPFSASNRWGYVAFSDLAEDAAFDANGSPTSGCILAHAVIEYAGGTTIQGAVHAEDSSPYIVDCLVHSNYHGGVFLRDAHGIRILGNSIADNSTPISGGGLHAIDVDDALIQSNLVTRNHAREGSGLYMNSCSRVRIEANRIVANAQLTVSTNGVLYPIGYEGGGMWLGSCGSFEVSSNTISSNAVKLTGGGLFMKRGEALDLHNNQFISNQARTAGAIKFTANNSVLAGNTILSNAATIGVAGIQIVGASNVGMTNNVLALNTTPGGGGALEMSSCQTIRMTGNLISNNVAATGAGISVSGSSQDIVLSTSRIDPTFIVAHTNLPIIRNDCPFAFTVAPDGASNVDGRRVWWGTRDSEQIDDLVHDFFDDAGKGIVVIDPHITFGLTLQTNGSGSIGAVPDKPFYEPDEPFELCATSSDHWYFSHWGGDIAATTTCYAGQASGDLVISVDFEAFSTQQGTPHWWLASHGMDTNDQAAALDPDEDSQATWREYIADTNPTNALSVLALTGLSFSNDSQIVSWKGGAMATQYLETADVPASDPTWHPVYTNHPPTTEIVTYTNGSAASSTGALTRIRAAR